MDCQNMDLLNRYKGHCSTSERSEKVQIYVFCYLCSVSSPRENKGRLTLVQFNGLFNKTITPITRSTKRRKGIKSQ